MNSVFFIGRVTEDVEVKYTNTQVPFTQFSIAVDRYTKEGEEKKADFPRIKVFGKQAESCGKYLGKGRKVAIEGSVQTGSYTKDNGEKVYTTDFVARRVEFLEWGSKETSETPENFQQINEPIPF